MCPERRVQRSVLFCFTLFFVISGIVYFNTSRVIRHSLPSITHVTTPDNININLHILLHVADNVNGQSVVEQLSSRLNTPHKSPATLQPHYHITHATYTTKLTASLQHQDASTAIEQALHAHLGSQYDAIPYAAYDFDIKHTASEYSVPPLHIFILPCIDCTPQHTVSTKRLMWARAASCESACVQQLADTVQHNVYGQLQTLDPKSPADLLKSNHNRLSFTLLNSVDTAHTWAFADIQRRYLQRFVDKLRPIVDLSVDSQIIYSTSLLPTIVQSTHLHHPHHNTTVQCVGTSQLSNFVGSTEWNVQSMFVQSSIELVVYMPSTHLYVYDDTDNRAVAAIRSGQYDIAKPHLHSMFSVPDYGYIVIANDVIESKQLDDSVIQTLMQIVIAQLRRSLGLQTKANIMHSSVNGITELEYDVLLVQSYIQHGYATADKLTALYTLIDDVSEMPVSDLIARNIDTVLHYHKHAQQAALQGDWYTASTLIGQAHTIADASFFDRDMLPNLYFPDQHLYAVYAPLYLPIAIPVLSAWWQLVKKRKAQ